jgi:uncharacterized membrane protein
VSRKTVSVTVNIDAPPDKVFAILCDVERWPEWTSTMASIKRLESGPFGAGSRARVCQPRLRPAVWQVTEFENQRNFTWSTRAAGLRMRAGHLIEPRDEGSCVTLSFELSGLIAPVVARFYAGLIERYITTESQGLKQRSESASSPLSAAAIGLDNK